MRGLVAVVVATGGLLLAQDARAYVINGDPWPGRTIPYFDAGPNPGAVRKAVALWNASGINVRFKAVPRRRARVLVTRSGTGCAGHAQIGYERHVPMASVQLSDCSTADSALGVATHEFGHILGLDHTGESCALMSPVVNSGCRGTDYQAYCRVIARDDLRGALKLYGGRAKPLGRRLCPYFAAPPTPTEFEIEGAAQSGPDGMVYASFRLALPRKLKEGGPPPPVTVSVYATRGDCPTSMPDGEPIAREELSPYVPASLVLGRRLDPKWEEGPYCFSAWARDALGRAAPGPALARTRFSFRRPAAGFSFFAAPAGEPTSFDDESDPGERKPVTYRWDFGDPSTTTDVSAERFPSYTYASPGDYAVTLTVRDADGVESTATQTVTVDPPPER